MLSLTNFHKEIDGTIVKRGQVYYNDNSVSDLNKSGDHWMATVCGSTDYTVEIKIDGDQVLDSDCDCPYDWGPYCKHIVAVLFAIRTGQNYTEYTEIKSTAGELADSAPPLQKIIQKMSEEEVRQTLLKLARKNQEVKNHLLVSFNHLLGRKNAKDIQKLIRSIIKSYQDRGRFVDYRNAMNLGHQLYDMVVEEDLNEQIRFDLSTEVIRQLAQLYKEGIDDSSGSIGSAISAAFQQLQRAIESQSSALLLRVHTLALQEMSQEKYKGYDWEDEWRGLAARSVQTKKEALEVQKRLQETIAQESQSRFAEYSIERAELLIVELLEKWEGEQVAEDYAKKLLHFSLFRERALKRAMKQADYKRVRQLATEGIVQSEKQRLPGLTTQWEKWLLKLAEATQDKEALLYWNEKRFLSSADMQYYREVKKLLSQAEFSKRVDKYLEHFGFQKVEKVYFFNTRVAQILEEEKRYDDLMYIISQYPDLDNLKRYRTLLMPGREAAYADLYAIVAERTMDRATGRSDYKECCRCLKEIIALGERALAENMSQIWRETYPRRRAMKEELEKIGL